MQKPSRQQTIIKRDFPGNALPRIAPRRCINSPGKFLRLQCLCQTSTCFASPLCYNASIRFVNGKESGLRMFRKLMQLFQPPPNVGQESEFDFEDNLQWDVTAEFDTPLFDEDDFSPADPG